ncbi:MAG TPA: general secretion pathway protein GspB [Steroidobacteraceae bacterium]|jgi:general secretion pathway protein B
MSFILDALKKSESDRQRQSGPGLYEVKVAPPRGGLPPWAVAVVILLAINLVIGLWMLVRHPAARAATEAVAVTAPVAAPVVAAPAAAPTVAPAPVVQIPAAPAGAPVSAPAAGSAAPASADVTHAGSLTPEDYAPAAEPAASALGGHVRRGTGGVPLYQDAAATPGTEIPQLRLDLHAYAARPQDRFVMINMHKVHEGDTLPEGVRVDSITPDGAVLSYKGSSFLLPRD